MADKNSIIINLFGAPGAGKSTLAAALFADLKCCGFNCELVTEYAKDLTWAKRFGELKVQPYIFGKQLLRIERVVNQVDYIITDSPLLLSLIYTNNEWPESYRQAVHDIFCNYNNINFLLRRYKPYNQAGRNQTEEESDNIHTELRKLLLAYNVSYTELISSTPERLVRDIKANVPLTYGVPAGYNGGETEHKINLKIYEGEE